MTTGPGTAHPTIDLPFVPHVTVASVAAPGRTRTVLTGGGDTLAAALPSNLPLGRVVVGTGPISGNLTSTTVGLSAGLLGVTPLHTTRKVTNCLPSNAPPGGTGMVVAVVGGDDGVLKNHKVGLVEDVGPPTVNVSNAATALGHGTV